ncbi:MAG: hypothetical protein AAF649_07100 [Verrucomicrobiota bacterium]
MKLFKLTLSLCAVMALTLTAPLASAHCGCEKDKAKKEEKTEEKKACCGTEGCCKEKKEEKKEA